MSTYLQLCGSVCRECGISGGEAVPTAVTGQVGELARVVGWVKQAWTEIQNRHPNWRWMRSSFTVSITSGDGIYAYGDCTDDDDAAPISRFSRWLVNDPYDPAKIYLTSAGSGTQGWLSYSEWNDFKRIYRIGTQNNAYPSEITIDPANNLVFGAVPNDTYTVTGDYQKSAQILSANADTPEMPSQFHDLIVWRAVKKYAVYESAPELLAQAEQYENMLMRQLEINQLPPMLIGGPIA